MPALSAEAANAVPAGFEVVAKDTPKPVVKVKDAQPAAKNEFVPVDPPAPAPAETETTEAAPAEAPAEPSPYDKAKQAADKAKKGAAANRRLREQGVQLQQQLQAQQAQASHLEAQLRQATQHLDHVMKDPLGAMKALGLTPQDLAKRVAMDGSPEGQIEALRAELQSVKDARERDAQAAREAEARTRQAQIENEYKQEAGNAKKYPNLATVHPDFILARTTQLVGQLWAEHRKDPAAFRAATGRENPSQITNHEYLVYLNDSYKPKVAAQEPAAPASAPAPETSGTQKKTATVTNKLASTKAALPADFSKMSDRQQRRIMAQQFRDLGIGH